jgi:Trypsin-like peptidase domain
MKLLRSVLSVATLLAVPSLGLAPRLSADDFDTEELYKKVLDSCVFIVTPMKGGHAEGSGSLVDAEKRLVITNYHVVDDADKIFCQFPHHLKDGTVMTDKKKYIERIPAGQACKGTVLHRDKTRDLAIVQLDKIPATAIPIHLARKSVVVGATTFNIGSPGAVSQVFSFTQGSVRAVGVMDFVVGGGEEILRIKAKMVTATNPTNPGDSGGPLFNKYGEQVAVTESGRQGVQAVNNFVDVTEVRTFFKEKKITFKELSTDPDPQGTKPKPKYGPDAILPNANKLNPPAPKVAPPVAITEKGTDTPPPAVSPEDEKAAAQALSRAKLFSEGDDNRPTYIAKLKDVVAKYPGTTAAKEASKTLEKMK